MVCRVKKVAISWVDAPCRPTHTCLSILLSLIGCSPPRKDPVEAEDIGRDIPSPTPSYCKPIPTWHQYRRWASKWKKKHHLYWKITATFKSRGWPRSFVKLMESAPSIHRNKVVGPDIHWNQAVDSGLLQAYACHIPNMLLRFYNMNILRVQWLI